MKESSRNYFTKETEEYIVKYNNSTDPDERQKIFTDHLYYPFYKLAECIIHTFKFYNTDVDQIEDLKCDIVRMICEEKIDKFNPGRGTKAYSYFGTIIKRWLIAYNIKNYNLKKKTVPIEYYTDNPGEDLEVEITPTISLSEFMDNWVAETYANLTELFPDQRDRVVADAVLTMFRTRQDLEVFQKRALYVYFREITGCETVYLTKVILRLKELFYEKYRQFLDKGLISE